MTRQSKSKQGNQLINLVLSEAQKNSHTIHFPRSPYRTHTNGYYAIRQNIIPTHLFVCV